MSIFYSGSLVSGAFGNLIAAGILSGLAGNLGMSAWSVTPTGMNSISTDEAS
jgi:hypothetical protein